MFDTVEFFSIGDGYDVGYVDAVVRPVDDSEPDEGTVWLDQGPPAKRYRGHAVTTIGDFELQTLAVKLMDADMDVEFQNGVLVCGEDQVILRRTKTDNGCKIEMEGALCPAYDQIRTMLYREFDFF